MTLLRIISIAMILGLGHVLPAFAVSGTVSGAISGAPEASMLPKTRPAINSAISPDQKSTKRDDALSRFIGQNSSIPQVSAVLIDVETGQIIEGHRPHAPMTPASVTKVVTTLYGFAELGADYRFRTRLRTNGAVRGAVLEGDLILEGGGDPVLDSDELGILADGLLEQGITSITGRFLYDTGALPDLFQIDASQPEHVVYNPAISGLNTNFNRVFFAWDLDAAQGQLRLEGRAEKSRPPSNVVRISAQARSGPVFDFLEGADRDHWTVVTSALAQPGGRWLPVRRPGIYTADLFRTLARARGLALPMPQAGLAPEGSTVLAQFDRRPLSKLVRGMLHFSTNLTAEVIGLTASGKTGLTDSAAAMTAWVRAQFDAPLMRFVDHSGLGDENRMSAHGMAQVMRTGWDSGALDGILRRYFVPGANGKGEAAAGVEVRAKTGSLNFVRGLSGVIQGTNGRAFAFAIFSRDPARRAAADHSLERPSGARSYSNRAGAIERRILRRWILDHAL